MRGILFPISLTRTIYSPRSLCLLPTKTEQISQILRYCNEKGLAVVPQGGNTGVSGGQNPVFDEIIVNMSKMNQIRSFDDLSGIAVVDGGVVLEALDGYLADFGYTVPLDLGAKGSCQLGGNISTNAGGLRLMRFGNLHGSVLGLEVVCHEETVACRVTHFALGLTGWYHHRQPLDLAQRQHWLRFKANLYWC